MNNLRVLRHHPMMVYRQIARARSASSRSVLAGAQRAIERAYVDYYARRPGVDRIAPLSLKSLGPRARGELQASYRSARRGTSLVFARFFALILSATDRCFYCGYDGVEQLDHYLPQARFPEFSLLPANLVPTCGGCNTSRDYRDALGRRALVHPYFDRIAQERLLSATVAVDGGVPSATFGVVGTARDLYFRALFARHLERLDLLSRFRAHAGGPYGLQLILRTMRVWASGRPTGWLVDGLVREAALIESRRGVNCVDAVLRRAAADSPEFLRLCQADGGAA